MTGEYTDIKGIFGIHTELSVYTCVGYAGGKLFNLRNSVLEQSVNLIVEQHI